MGLPRHEHMLLTIGLLTALAVLSYAAHWPLSRVAGADLGWMSAHWLAQYRASRPG